MRILILFTSVRIKLHIYNSFFYDNLNFDQ